MTKKIDKDEALAKIKTKISNFYEKCGREMVDDVEVEKQELIDEIDKILCKTEISQKHLVIARLQSDNEVNELLKKEWTNE